jgi:hypothetical protein
MEELNQGNNIRLSARPYLHRGNCYASRCVDAELERGSEAQRDALADWF